MEHKSGNAACFSFTPIEVLQAINLGKPQMKAVINCISIIINFLFNFFNTRNF